MAPWRVGGRVGQQCAQFSRGAFGIPALQRSFGAIKTGPWIAGRFGKLGFGLRRHGTVGPEHEHLAKFRM